MCYNTPMALVQNRKIHFNYEILEKIEAGIKLQGFEVKSLKDGRGSLEGAYVTLKNGAKPFLQSKNGRPTHGSGSREVFLVHAYIPPFQPKNTPEGYDPYRERKLLLNKDEIAHLVGFEKQRGLTIVPTSVYNKQGKVKVEIGIARGKKKYDKRETIKRRDIEREIGRSLKN